jgi:plasminogen activator inhibitor 1 RNA-binding protein
MRSIGNDHDQDPDREPEPPTRAIDKPVARSGKRDAGPQAPSESTGSRGGRGGRGGARSNETGSERGMT